MAEDMSEESAARASSAAARRAAYENGENARVNMVTEDLEQRSRWDTTMQTTTTPQSALNNWGRGRTSSPPAADATGGTPAPASEQPPASNEK